MEPWRTAIATSDANGMWIRGRDVMALMSSATFTDVIVLLHLGRLPSPGERRLLDAILIGVCDHGAGAPSCAAARLAASGNRQSVAAAIAAGVLTIGDEHGGAGSACMDLIGQGLALALIGVVTGGIAAAVLGRFVETQLYSVQALDIVSFAVTAGVMIATAFIASVVPALRTLRIDPINALRGE
jgi:citrate synthase